MAKFAPGPAARKLEIEIGVPTAEVLDNIAAVGPTLTTERTVTLTLPAGATIQKASLVALITAMNNTANTQKIDIEVQAKEADGTFAPYFSEDDCLGVPNVDGATASFVAISDVGDLVTATGTYHFRISIVQSSANSVLYTTQYILLITYTLG